MVNEEAIRDIFRGIQEKEEEEDRRKRQEEKEFLDNHDLERQFVESLASYIHMTANLKCGDKSRGEVIRSHRKRAIQLLRELISRG